MPAYDVEDEVQQIRIVIEGMAGHPRRLLALLMLTGCRLSEIQKLRWQHVDLGAGELRLPDTKTGAKVVYLGDPAIAVNGGVKMYRRGGVKTYQGLGGSLSP